MLAVWRRVRSGSPARCCSPGGFSGHSNNCAPHPPSSGLRLGRARVGGRPSRRQVVSAAFNDTATNTERLLRRTKPVSCLGVPRPGRTRSVAWARRWKGQVRAHGGAIRAENRETGGARVALTLRGVVVLPHVHYTAHRCSGRGPRRRFLLRRLRRRGSQPDPNTRRAADVCAAADRRQHPASRRRVSRDGRARTAVDRRNRHCPRARRLRCRGRLRAGDRGRWPRSDSR